MVIVFLSVMLAAGLQQVDAGASFAVSDWIDWTRRAIDGAERGRRLPAGASRRRQPARDDPSESQSIASDVRRAGAGRRLA
jgi:hypothetical protein